MTSRDCRSKLGALMGIIAVLAAGLFMPAAPASAAADGFRVHTIGIVPFYTPEKIWTLYEPFSNYLSERTGFRWRLVLFKDHGEIITALCKGELSVAFLGPVPAAKAIAACNVRPLATAIGIDGRATYRGVMLTGDDTVKSVKDLKGKQFGLFMGSTIAHHVALGMLRSEGIAPTDITPRYLVSQDRIIAALLAGDISGGVVKETLAGKFAGMNLRVLKTSQPLPNFTFFGGPGCNADAFKSLKNALLSLSPSVNPRDREAVAKWDVEITNGFVAPPADLPRKLRELEQVLTVGSRQ